MRTGFTAFGIFLVSFVLILALTLGGTVLRGLTAPLFGWADAEVQIESAESRIARYEHFFGLCSAVESYEDQIVVLEEQLENTDKSDSKEVNRLNSSIAGLKGQRSRSINDYNAQARMEYTSARFHDSSLPYQLTVEGENRCDVYY